MVLLVVIVNASSHFFGTLSSAPCSDSIFRTLIDKTQYVMQSTIQMMPCTAVAFGDSYEDDEAASAKVWHVEVPCDGVYFGGPNVLRELQLLIAQGDASKIHTISIDNDCVYAIPKSLCSLHLQ